MRVTICTVGRLKAGPERDLIDRYRKRIQWPFEFLEVEERRKLSAAELQLRESNLLISATPAEAVRIAMDERGKTLSSESFAEKLGEWRDQGRDIAFIIGGAGGLAPENKVGADLVLSFGAATWPHMLVRVMLVEQIYRAQEILAGNPYHRA
ncbi:MAG: 23S rRNA (pseudouridine(1915)-N(3))-methyltransferase RlmH [Rhodospirillaceae bacterium]|nr:23S rRNA (pseudouridine(1915)-N(3))-methyltransferase RlmH [Rhodospirillaceae bacterium]